MSDRSRAVPAVGVGALCVQLDAFALNLVLPRIGRDLGGSSAHLGWVVSSYLLACGSLMLGAGRIGDRIGHHRLLRGSLIAFAGASALCASAPNLPFLVAARVLQGAAAAPIMPAGLALLSSRLPPGARERATGRALGIGGLGTAAGPLVGGGLVAAWSWRGVFWLDVPCALAAAWLLGPVREPRGKPLAPAHRIGLVAVTGAVATLALLLDRGPLWGWRAPGLWGLVAGGCSCLGVLRLAEQRGSDRLFRPELLRTGRFVALTAAGAAANAATVVVLLVVPWRLSEVWGLGPLPAALAFLAPAAALALAGPTAGRVPGRRALAVSVLGLLTAAALLPVTAAGSLPGSLTAATGSAAALGISNALAMTATQARLPPEVAGEAAGLTKTVLTLAAGLALLLIGPGGRLARTPAVHALQAAGLSCLVAALLLAALSRAGSRRPPGPATP